MSERFLRQLDINSNHVNPHMAEFASFLRREENRLFLDNIFQDLNERRPDLTSLHFGLLVYSGAQLALLEQLPEPILREVSSWDEAMKYLDKRLFFAKVAETCSEKFVAITSPFRYGALAVASKYLFSDKTPSVVDVGCGFYPLGIGKLSIETLPEPQDLITGEICRKLGEGERIFGSIIALDIQGLNPVWAAASIWQPVSQLPDSLTKMRLALEEKSNVIKFVKGDITDSHFGIPGLKADICWVANLIYQVPAEKASSVERNINELLDESGWFLLAEYAAGGSQRRPFSYQIVGRQKKSGVLSDPQILFELDSADCRQIRYAEGR